MGKKVREFKSGDFIFAKVKGYPAWPARVQKLNGKKYFVYFYGTGEIANLAPNMIFDYAENKDKFLTKTVKRRDFNDGVKQIEFDFANNVPLEQVVGAPIQAPPNDSANETMNDSAINETMDSVADTTAADDTVADTAANTTNNDTAVDDSDDPTALIIDEGKKGKKPAAKTPAKEVPKTPKTPRGKPKKEEQQKEEKEEEKHEEIVSRSGRKIRPKRYIDEQTEDNATLPAPATKKRRAASPPPAPAQPVVVADDKDKNIKHFNTVTQAELEDLKEPFKPADPQKENILIAYLPAGQYVGVKLGGGKGTGGKLAWDRQLAANAVTLKLQLERGQITPQSVTTQLVTDLNLTDEEKAALDKERETDEKKGRVQFLKTEMKLIELDAKIKTCLSLEKADTELCLKLLDELTELEVKPLMLLKHPTCLETVKRMRAYVGNTPCWDLSEGAALTFGKQAHRIRRQADTLYRRMKELFTTPEGVSFWEHFSERVLHFKKVTANLNADELLEMVHEPLEMSSPSTHSLQSAVEAANEAESPLEEDEVPLNKRKDHNVKTKKPANSTPAKTPLKRQASKKQVQEQKETNKQAKEQEKESEKPKEAEKENVSEQQSKSASDKMDDEKTEEKEKEQNRVEDSAQKEAAAEKEAEPTPNSTEQAKEDEPNKEEKKNEDPSTGEKGNEEPSKEEKESEESSTTEDKKIEESSTAEKNKEPSSGDKTKEPTVGDKKKESSTADKKKEETSKAEKKKEESSKAEKKKEEVKEAEKEKEKEVADEPRAKRSRGESKKTEPPPRSPAKRKTKA